MGATATTQESSNGPTLPEVVSREDLDALVWSEPMSRLSRRFGLSDVGLAKACTRGKLGMRAICCPRRPSAAGAPGVAFR